MLLQLRQDVFDLIEVRQLARVVAGFGVADDALLVDHESRAFGDAAHAQILLREEAIVRDTVRAGDLVLVIGEQGHRDLFLLGPRALRERVVAANAEHVGIETSISAQSLAHLAHFLRAHARERHREEQQDGVLPAEIAAELDLLRALGRFRGQFKIQCLVANFQCHVCSPVSY